MVKPRDTHQSRAQRLLRLHIARHWPSQAAFARAVGLTNHTLSFLLAGRTEPTLRNAVLIESNYDPGMLREGPYPWSLKERILGRYGHLSNGDVASYLGRSLGESCRTVILAHLSKTNNHPDVARMSAEAALRRRGRTEVRLEVTGEEGTEWMSLVAAIPPPRRPQQLRLF